MKRKLSFKFILGFIFLGVLVCTVSSLIGYKQYKNAIMSQYNDTAYRTAQLALSYLSIEQLESLEKEARNIACVPGYADSVHENMTDTAEYMEVREALSNLRDKMGANDIFVFSVDDDELKNFNGNTDNWNPLIYIFDCYYVEEQSYTLGNTGAFNPKYIKEIEQIISTGQKVNNYFISKGPFGYNTYALLPVVEAEKTIAVIAVEIPMLTLEKSLRRYINYAIITVIIICVVIAVDTAYFYRTIIIPIKCITGAAGDFVKNQNEVSDELKKINTNDEIEGLAKNVLKMEKDINEYIDNLTKVTAEKERIGTELSLAAKIQAAMLPSVFPAFPERKEIDIYATMDPAKEVGGDFYDFFFVNENHMALIIADVSGKGIPASLFMVIAKTVIKNRALVGGSPSQIIEFANNQLCEGNDMGMFVTVWLGIIDIRDGSGIASNAGHEHPVIRRAGGKYELVKTKHSTALAVMEGLPFEEHEFKLNPGDSLFLYTDGVPEAGNSASEFFGFDRLLAALNSEPVAKPQKVTANVKNAIDEFVKEADQFDDITMLSFNYLGQEVSKND